MKKYYICFFILAALLAAGVLTGAYFYIYRPEKEGPVPNGVIESETIVEDNMVINQAQVEKREGGYGPGESEESRSEKVAGPADAVSQAGGPNSGGQADGENSSAGPADPQNAGTAGDGAAESTSDGETPDGEKRYCLVAENGFLLVFAKDRDTVCLDTHMPLTEFPEKEQERLTDGIWFSTMIEILNYLESYSS